MATLKDLLKKVDAADLAYLYRGQDPIHGEPFSEELVKAVKAHLQSLAEIVKVVEDGWYWTTVGAVRQWKKENPCESPLSDGDLNGIAADWELTFPGRGDEAPVIAYISSRGFICRGFICSVTRPLQGDFYGHFYIRYDGYYCYLTDGKGFSVLVGDQDSMAHYRAIAVLSHFGCIGGTYTPIMLEWIFADTGDGHHVLSYLESAVSGRGGTTMSEARRLARAALGRTR